MAFDPTPTTWLAGWSEDGTNISVPIATFAELSAAEADGATGDIRKILFAVCEQFKTTYNATASGDRPLKMRFFSASSTNEATGILTRQYQFVFDIAISAMDVAAEA